MLMAAFASSVLAGESSTTPTDEDKLEMILAGKEELSRADRIRNFAHDGEIDAVGRLVTIGNVVYFKTADQSFIPQGKRFPYPELFLELHMTETHAYKPLDQQSIIKRRRVLYDGPIRIHGNWAYEGAYHIFGLVWVDKVSKASNYPEVDWGPWLEKRNEPRKRTRASDR